MALTPFQQTIKPLRKTAIIRSPKIPDYSGIAKENPAILSKMYRWYQDSSL